MDKEKKYRNRWRLLSAVTAAVIIAAPVVRAGVVDGWAADTGEAVETALQGGTDPASGQTTAPAPEPAAETEPAAGAESTPDPAPAPEPETTPASESAPEAETTPAPEPEPVTEPETEATPDPEPESTPDPAPETEPETPQETEEPAEVPDTSTEGSGAQEEEADQPSEEPGASAGESEEPEEDGEPEEDSEPADDEADADDAPEEDGEPADADDAPEEDSEPADGEADADGAPEENGGPEDDEADVEEPEAEEPEAEEPEAVQPETPAAPESPETPGTAGTQMQEKDVPLNSFTMEVLPELSWRPSEYLLPKELRTKYETDMPLEGIPSFITSEMITGALKVQDEYGYPASVTIAQIIQESGYGTYGPGGEDGRGLSYLAYQYNNLFGIKGTGTAGSVDLLTGEETVLGQRYMTTAGFRAYYTYTESMEDRAELLKEVYSDLIEGVQDANTFAMRIAGRWGDRPRLWRKSDLSDGDVRSLPAGQDDFRRV